MTSFFRLLSWKIMIAFLSFVLISLTKSWSFKMSGTISVIFDIFYAFCKFNTFIPNIFLSLRNFWFFRTISIENSNIFPVRQSMIWLTSFFRTGIIDTIVDHGSNSYSSIGWLSPGFVKNGGGYFDFLNTELRFVFLRLLNLGVFCLITRHTVLWINGYRLDIRFKYSIYNFYVSTEFLIFS
jgi:hypothetical protein